MVLLSAGTCLPVLSRRLAATVCVVGAVMFVARTLAAEFPPAAPPPAAPPPPAEEPPRLIEEDEGFSLWGRPFSENERLTLGFATCASFVPVVASGIYWTIWSPSLAVAALAPPVVGGVAMWYTFAAFFAALEVMIEEIGDAICEAISVAFAGMFMPFILMLEFVTMVAYMMLMTALSMMLFLIISEERRRY